MLERLREIFKESGKSQTEIAKKTNVTSAYIWKILNKDNVKPRDLFIKKVCEEFAINEDWLRNGTPPKKPLDKLSTYLGQIDKGNDEFIKDLIVAYMELDPDSKKALRILTEKMYENRKERGE